MTDSLLCEGVKRPHSWRHLDTLRNVPWLNVDTGVRRNCTLDTFHCIHCLCTIKRRREDD